MPAGPARRGRRSPRSGLRQRAACGADGSRGQCRKTTDGNDDATDIGNDDGGLGGSGLDDRGGPACRRPDHGVGASELSQHRQFRALARRLQEGGRGEGDFGVRHQRRFALPRATTSASSISTAASASSARPSSNSPTRCCPPTGCRPGAAKIKQYQSIFAARGEGIRRARPRHHRVLGARKRFRRRPGQGPGDQVAHHARLRLPPLRDVPRPPVRRAAADRARRPARRRDDRLLGRRTRADPDDAVRVLP